MSKYCVVNGQVAIFKGEVDEMLTIEPIQDIDYLFDEKDLVEVTTGGRTYSGVVTAKGNEVAIAVLGNKKADEIIGRVISYENGDAICKGVVLDVAGEVYVTHQTDDEIVYIPKEVAELC